MARIIAGSVDQLNGASANVIISRAGWQQSPHGRAASNVMNCSASCRTSTSHCREDG
jgi:hypothetical protein